MRNTAYYNLNIVDGTDIVNPLTVDNPNYERIDEAMHDNAVAGVTLATEIANAAVHAITRENSECAVIRFIATSNWKAGDTITVDGVPVTALLPSGESLPDGAYVINANVLCILTGTNLTVFAEREKIADAYSIDYNDTTVGDKLTEMNNNLASQKDNISTQEEILVVTTSDLTSGAPNTYSCNWEKYELLLVTIGSYWNVENSLILPTSYFAVTNSGSRPTIRRPDDVNSYCQLYQLGHGTIALNPSQNSVDATSLKIRIYGVIAK